MNSSDIKKRLDFLRLLYKQSNDPVEKEHLVAEAGIYRCTHVDHKNGKSVRCKNPRRSLKSFVCVDHVVKYKKTGLEKKYTLREIQEGLLNMRSSSCY